MAEQINVTENSPHVIISQGTVPTLPDNVITGNLIANSAVTSAKIADGTIVNTDINASAAIDVSKLSGVVTSAGVGNLLTSAQATGSEAPTNGVNTNCTLSIDNSQYYQGTDSLLMTSSASGVMASKYFTVSLPAAGTYTVFCRVRTDQTVMGLIMSSTGTGITSDSAKVAANSTGWTNYVSVITTTQATTLNLYAASTGTYGHPTGAGQKLWLDTLGVWQGAGGLWALPGTPIANLGTYTDETVGRRIFTWDTVNSRWQMTYGDTGWRDVSALLANGWGGTLLVRRHNGRVSWRTGLGAASLDGTSASAVTAFTMSSIDAGFRNDTSGRRTLVYNSSDTTFTVAAIGSDALIMPAYGAGKKYNFVPEAVYTADNAWPTSLPGTAVGTIPYA